MRFHSINERIILYKKSIKNIFFNELFSETVVLLLKTIANLLLIKQKINRRSTVENPNAPKTFG